MNVLPGFALLGEPAVAPGARCDKSPLQFKLLRDNLFVLSLR